LNRNAAMQIIFINFLERSNDCYIKHEKRKVCTLSLKSRFAEAGFSYYCEDVLCFNDVEESVFTLLYALNKSAERPLVYVCIGTDKATGDCLGPLVGSKLKTMLPTANVYGTLKDPLHAVNLQANIEAIQKLLLDPFIIAVDACLGNAERVGFINIKPGGLLPGSALQKSLPYVGDFHISGVVNVAGCFDHLVLQNTRLFLVDRMATIIAKSLYMANYRFIQANTK